MIGNQGPLQVLGSNFFTLYRTSLGIMVWRTKSLWSVTAEFEHQEHLSSDRILVLSLLSEVSPANSINKHRHNCFPSHPE